MKKGEFMTSPEFMQDIVRLAMQCIGVGSSGCIFRTPEIDGECLEVDFHFKMITKEDK